MPLEKLCCMKSKQIPGTKPGTDPPQSFELKTLFYPVSIMPKIFIKDTGNLKHPKKCEKYQ